MPSLFPAALSAIREPDTGDRALAWGVAASLLILTVPRLYLHELWRDEAWLWLVVLQSDTLRDLFPLLARSGQGSLFPVLAYLAGQVSASPRALQALHLLLATGAAFVFVRWAPFERRERVLFVAGYFPAYEYAVISRHYVAGLLLVWLALVAMRGRRPGLGVGAALGLLCQTTVYGVICAIALACGWLYDRRRRRGEVARLEPADAIAGAALGVVGAVAGVWQLVPLEGTSFAPGWFFAWDTVHMRVVLFTAWRALVPLSWPELHFWNINVLEAWPQWHTAAGLAAVGLSGALLWRRPVALATFAIGALGLLGFAYVKYVGLLRHQGHWWLLLVAALWLDLQGRPTPRARDVWQRALFATLLVVHVAAGLYASAVDLVHPFSNGLATAALLREQGLDRAPLFGHREPPAATVALGVGAPLFSPSRGVYATHPDWGPDQRELPQADVRCAARALARREDRDVVFVSNSQLPRWSELTNVGARAGAILESEDFYVYRVNRDALAATDGEARCGEDLSR